MARMRFVVISSSRELPESDDYLELRLAGASGRHYNSDVEPGSGSWTFSNCALVSFEGIERVSPPVPGPLEENKVCCNTPW